MDLNELLTTMDRVAANLAKLDAIWARASPMIPTGPSLGSSREYDDLRRVWTDITTGLPPIDGWTITPELPDADEIGRAFLDYMDIGEQPFNIYAQVEAPGKDLDEYRFRLGRARRRAVRERLHELGDRIDQLLPELLADVPSDSMEVVDDPRADETRLAVGEIERLLGDTTKRVGRWGDLHRHLYFGQGHDWHDIATLDWPTVRLDIHAADLSDEEPIPVPPADLGLAASSNLTGSATAALDWANLADDGFERLLFDLLRGLEGYQNVEWLTNTHAPDRGRDLSLERVIRDSSGTTRIERVIVQAKHWTRKSVAVPDVSGTVATVPLWEPPVVRALIIATSGRFTSDAVAWVESHNGLFTIWGVVGVGIRRSRVGIWRCSW